MSKFIEILIPIMKRFVFFLPFSPRFPVRFAGRGKMKKTMGMMMTVAAMKAMMIIPLALGLLFLMAGKAMIISKIALVLSLIITLKKLLTKSGEHVVHETHTAAAAWPSVGGPIGAGGGWDKRSSSAVAAGQMLAYGNPYKP